jgi:uncharacterized metal-binding protein
MSTGRVHTRVTLLIAAEFAVATIVSLDVSNVQYVAGALLGVILQPDLDVNHGKTHSNNLVSRLGLVPYIGWQGVWYMYRRSLKHGGDLSHFPVIGTLGRIGYLFLFAIVFPNLLLSQLFDFDFWYETSWWAWKIALAYKVILGLMTTDFFHWLLDVTTKEHKNETDKLRRSKRSFGPSNGDD